MLRPTTTALLFSLVFRPSQACGVAAERRVTFAGSEDVTLAGTLELPAGDGACPALVLVAGSGPTDRDGNQPPGLMTDLLKQIAAGLAQQGIASL